MHAGHCRKDRIKVKTEALGRRLHLVRQHIEQDFRVRIGVDVPPVETEHLFLQLLGVGQVAIVREHQAERRIDVERLRLGRIRRRTGRRVTAVSDAHVAGQRAHVARAEYVAHQPGALVHEKRIAVTRRDAGGVLAAMLENHQSVIEQLIDR